MTDTTDQAPQEQPQDAPQTPPEGTTAPEGTDTPNAPQNAAQDTDTGENGQGTDTTEDDQDKTSANAEAAKWRTRLREEEARTAELTALNESLTVALINAYVTPHMAPSLIWAAGIEPHELTGDDGLPDTEAIDLAVDAVSDHFGLQLPTPQGARPGKINTSTTPPKVSLAEYIPKSPRREGYGSAKAAPTWADAIRRGR